MVRCCIVLEANLCPVAYSKPQAPINAAIATSWAATATSWAATGPSHNGACLRDCRGVGPSGCSPALLADWARRGRAVAVHLEWLGRRATFGKPQHETPFGPIVCVCCGRWITQSRMLTVCSARPATTSGSTYFAAAPWARGRPRGMPGPQGAGIISCADRDDPDMIAMCPMAWPLGVELG